jgi:hypothetical protein
LTYPEATSEPADDFAAAKPRTRDDASHAEPDIDDDLVGADPRVIAQFRATRADDFVLPNCYLPTPPAAARIFGRMGARRELFQRGGRAVEVSKDGEINIIDANAFRSRLDRKRRVLGFVATERGELVLKPRRCSHDTAALLLATREARELLPRISVVAAAPVLVEHDGELVTLGRGYSPLAGGIFVRGGDAPVEVPLDEAVRAISDVLLDDFKFAADSDRSRAVAALVAPALRIGGLIRGHAPIIAVEADQSQTGKGFLLSLIRAVYRERGALIAQRDGGVGSVDESLASALVSGASFIVFDNIRGRISSQYLEAVLTSHDPVPARIPHKGEVAIDAARVSFQLTSNGVEATCDLANRMLVVNILKQSQDYVFREFQEGNLLQHVEARQPFWLGCVHAVVKAWHAAGRPKLRTSHSFHEWIGTTDWIVQRVFGLPPLLAGHDGTVARVADAGLTWLRAIAPAALRNFSDRELSASALAELAEDEGLPVPRTEPGAPVEVVARQLGRLMGKAFAHSSELKFDSVTVRRVEREEHDVVNRSFRRVFRYCFIAGS